MLAGADRGAGSDAELLRRGRRRARPGDRRSHLARRRAAVRGGAGGGQEQPTRRGHAPDLRLLADVRLRQRLRPQRHPPPARRGLRRSSAPRRCPEYGILPTSEARLFGPTRNPWDLAAHARRLLGRRRRGGRRRHGAGRPRQRRRRLDPHPRRLLRPRRAEAEPGPHLGGARTGRLLAGHRRHADAHRRRDRRDPRRARRLRAGRRDLGAAAVRAVRRSRSAAIRGGCGSR